MLADHEIREEWWVLVANNDGDKCFAVIGPFNTQLRAEHEAVACGAGYARVGSKP